MKIAFSVSNGFFLLIAFSLLFKQLNSLWESGFAGSMNSLFVSLLLCALYLLNIYSFWRYPGLIISSVQIFVNLILIPVLYGIFFIAVPLAKIVLSKIDPTADFGELSKLYYIINFFTVHTLLTIGFIIFNTYKARKIAASNSSS